MFVDSASTSPAVWTWEMTRPRVWEPVAGVVVAVPTSNPTVVIWAWAAELLSPTMLGMFSFLGPWSLGILTTQGEGS